MLVTQEVVDGFDGVEGFEGHFDEDCRPVAHGAIPKSGQFQCLQLATILGLVGDEASGGVYVAGQVEMGALVVAGGADEIYWIEVSAALEHSHIGGVVGVNL